MPATAPAPFDATALVAFLPCTLLAACAAATVLLALVRRHRKRAARGCPSCGRWCLDTRGNGFPPCHTDHPDAPPACTGWAAPDGCAFGLSPAAACLADRPCCLDASPAAVDASLDAATRDAPDPEPEAPVVILHADGSATFRGVIGSALTGEPVTGTATITPNGGHDAALTPTTRAALDTLGVELDPPTEPEPEPYRGRHRRAAIDPPPYLRDPEPVTLTAAITAISDPGSALSASVPRPWLAPLLDWIDGRTDLLDFRGAEVPEPLRTLLALPGPVDADGYAERDWDDWAKPTAAQWARWYVACAPAARERIAGYVQEAFDARQDCFLRDHAKAAEERDRAWVRVDELANDLARARYDLGTQQARADDLRAVLDAAYDELAHAQDAAQAAQERAEEERTRAARWEARATRLQADLAETSLRADWQARYARAASDLDATREELAATTGRAQDAEHDLAQTRAALDRAHDNHRRIYDALAACEAAYAAAQEEWRREEAALRRRMEEAVERADAAAAERDALRAGRAPAAPPLDRSRSGGMLTRDHGPTLINATADDREVWHAAQHVGTVVPAADACAVHARAAELAALDVETPADPVKAADVLALLDTWHNRETDPLAPKVTRRRFGRHLAAYVAHDTTAAAAANA